MQAQFRRLGAAMSIVFILTGLSACDSPFCEHTDRLEARIAAAYLAGQAEPPRLPLNAWVSNEWLESALRAAIDKSGVARVASEYRLECVPRPAPATCADCYTCNRTVAMHFYSGHPFASCHGFGETQVRAEIGPGSAVRVMTYWKNP